ncbi:unnamed protein product, partial [Prorocentrum cordatum]
MLATTMATVESTTSSSSFKESGRGASARQSMLPTDASQPTPSMSRDESTVLKWYCHCARHAQVMPESSIVPPTRQRSLRSAVCPARMRSWTSLPPRPAELRRSSPSAAAGAEPARRTPP